MNRVVNAPHDETIQEILTALRVCYGRLDEPDFHKVYATLRAAPFQGVIDSLRSSGADITDTTDLNNDVSIRLVLDQSEDQVGLALSGVGPFAALVHQDSAQDYFWVTQPEKAPTPLAAMVARTVQRAGFELLSRNLVSQTIAMTWYDGSTEVTLYQALFTDTDWVP